MKVSTEQRADRQAVVQIEVEPVELEQALERAYRRVVRQVNIHGFRPGKAPRRIVEQRLGRGVLLDEAARDLIPKLTQDAIEEQQFEAIGQPSVEITQVEPLTFTATISLRPTVDLGDYTAIRLAPRETAVTDEQVEEVITRLREAQGTWELPSEARPAADGDQVTIDLRSTLDGEPLDEPQTGVPVVLGRPGPVLPEIAEALAGLSVGESAQLSIPFPEDHPDAHVAGKAPVFDVTVTGIKSRWLPPLDDAFAAAVSDAETLDGLRERIRANLQAMAEAEARREMAQAVLDLVTAQATIAMPPVLVEDQITHQLDDRRQRYERQGLKWEAVLRVLGQTEEQLRDEIRPDAERRVRGSLALMEVARRENIAITPAEIDAEIERLIEPYEDEAQRARARQTFQRQSTREAIQFSLFESKTIDRLIEIATEGRGPIVRAGEAPALPGLSEALEAAAEAPAEAAAAEPAGADATAATPAAETAPAETAAER